MDLIKKLPVKIKSSTFNTRANGIQDSAGSEL